MLVCMLMLGMVNMTALASDEAVDVYVTVSDGKGSLVLAKEQVSVTDVDADGVISISDALYAAHEANFEGGAAAGFASSMTEYGLSLDKLWGVANGGSYGYYVNNVSAWSLGDAVKDGDHVKAYVYIDLTAWSDTYCYFDSEEIVAKAGDEISLTLTGKGYDESWNPVDVPVEGATITLNGEATEFKTDAEGKVIITIEEAGDYVVSAVSDTAVLVPPVAKATVEGTDIAPTATPAPVETATPAPAETATPAPETTTTPSTGATVTAPKTDDNSEVVMYAILFAIAMAGITVYGIKVKKAYEK